MKRTYQLRTECELCSKPISLPRKRWCSEKCADYYWHKKWAITQKENELKKKGAYILKIETEQPLNAIPNAIQIDISERTYKPKLPPPSAYIKYKPTFSKIKLKESKNWQFYWEIRSGLKYLKSLQEERLFKDYNNAFYGQQFVSNKWKK